MRAALEWLAGFATPGRKAIVLGDMLELGPEAHRFAVSRHRSRRSKRTLSSQLLAVPGIGPGRTRALLNRFGSVRGVQKASIEELQRALGP